MVIILIALLYVTFLSIIAEASDITVLETNVSEASSGNVLVGVPGTFYSTDENEMLALMNEVRKEAYDENLEYPKGSGKYLGVDYPYVPLKWSSQCEQIARIRAAEVCLLAGHSRPGGGSTFLELNSFKSNGEVIAWNKSVLNGIRNKEDDNDSGSWYAEKQYFIDKDIPQNSSDYVQGHYIAMINPDNKYVGISGFKGSYGFGYLNSYLNIIGEFTTTSSSLDQTFNGWKGEYIHKVETKADYVYMNIDGNNALHIGDQEQFTPNVTVKTGEYGSENCILYADVAWTSSDSGILSVDKNTGKAKANSAGSVTLTATVTTGSKTITATEEVVVLPDGVEIEKLINPEVIQVNTGTKPVLPDTVKAQLSNGDTVDVHVVWEELESDYTKSNSYRYYWDTTFDVKGTFQDYTVAQKIKVIAMIEHFSLSEDTITVDSGQKPTYPIAKTITLTSGVYFSNQTLKWTDNEVYKKREGGTFTVEGVWESNTNKKAEVTLIVNTATVTDVVFDEKELTTASGREPEYPKAKVTWSNGDVTEEDIAWVETENFKNAYKNREGGTYTITGNYGDEQTSVKVNVNPATVTDVSFDDEDINVENGTAPVLPAKATVTWSNGDVEDTDITWNKIETASYKNLTGGEFSVEGTVAGKTFSVKCIVAPPVVESVEKFDDVSTLEEIAPVLPQRAYVSWNNGMETFEDIVWDSIPKALYVEPDTEFTVYGSLKGHIGTDNALSMKVSVKAKSLVGLEWKQDDPSGVIFYDKYDWSNIKGSVIAEYNNGTKDELDINDTRLVISGYDNDSVEKTQTVSIAYTYGVEDEAVTKLLTIDVILHLPQKLEVTEPSKTVYVEGQSLDTDGIKVVTVYDDGKKIDPNGNYDHPVFTLEGYDNAKIGLQTITVTQNGIKGSFEVEVIPKEAVAVSVSTIYPQKVGKELDPGNSKVTVTFNDGDEKTYYLSDLIADENIQIKGYKKDEIGEQTLTVIYDKVSCDIKIEVRDKIVTNILVIDEPDRLDYIEGIDLDLTGGLVQIFYDNDTDTEVSIDVNMISGFDKNTIGDQVIVVEVDGKTDTFKVNVRAKQIVSRYVIKPERLTYIEGMELKLDGGSIYTAYDNGTDEIIPLTDDAVKYILVDENGDSFDVNVLKAGEYELQFYYMGNEVSAEDEETVKVIVKAPVSEAKAEVSDSSEVEFSSDADNETIQDSLAGMVINVPCADGTTEEVVITKEMITSIVDDENEEGAGSSDDSGYAEKIVKIRIGTKDASEIEEGNIEDDGIYVYLTVKVEKKKITDNSTTDSNTDAADETDDNAVGSNGEGGSQNGAGGIGENGDTTGNGSSGSDSQDDSGREAGKGSSVTGNEDGSPHGGSDNGEDDNSKATGRRSCLRIKLAKTSISKLVSKKKAITVKWKKASAYYNVTGYQIQLSLNKNFKKNTKTVTISKRKTASKTIKKLKSKKKYYVRIRSYYKSGSHGWYSAWSKVKTVKTK